MNTIVIARSGATKQSLKRGFTLIEVLASIVLIALVLIPIMTIVPQMIENSLKSERLTKVIFLAERKTEEVMGELINNFGASIATSGNLGGNYEYTVALAQDGSIPIADLKIITVRVWYDEDGDGTFDDDMELITIALDTKVADR